MNQKQIGNEEWNMGKIIKRSILAIILVFLISIPFWAIDYLVMIFLLIFLYVSLGQMWNLLAGYAGLVSLGQQIFIGLGGYSLAILSEFYHIPLAIGILVGGILSAIFALIISQPIFKMSGAYFTIGTWVVAEALVIFFGNWAFVRYGRGITIRATYNLTMSQIYLLAFVVGIGSIILVYYIMRSKLGLALMAMRDNEAAAETMGVELYKTKLITFLISAFVTGMTGAVMYIYLSDIKPVAAFSIDWTVSMVFIVIIGGIGTMEGPILGAIVYVLLKQYLYDFPGISMIILGVVAIAIILGAPKGIMGTLHDKFGFEILSPRRRVKEVKM